MSKTYKIRKFQNGRNKDGDPFINYSLTIPSEIAEKLPADLHFACELTDDGILFRPSTKQEEQIELPTWAKNGGRKMAETQTRSQRSGKGRKRPAREKVTA